ncbi:MAG: pyridoxal-dependent decarboxylase [Saprospiraceae bacterium]|nr:pyridoxal-dependent decarboxylase [Saprospiraceae bacterium]MBK6815911.1 pyridoxal-dependent decarboxylase [Saprospiraceae bacterium]MBK7370617.1 pyridoxal-dependent decarboxylase [Saprospiraceae bacterium]MBK7438776.1 pyridoxal-dependent decarboxylase [Saprospiraceae bacterium]MBK8279190.1 pyridoxal-dependent decarboxylase [Saprospiraceae bacterium]
MTDPDDPIELFRKHGHLLIDFIANYLTDCSNEHIRVTQLIDPEDSYHTWLEELIHPTLSVSQLSSKIISDSIHLHHPGYVGHQVANSHPFALLSDLSAGLLNNGMAVYEMGQVSVAMERAVCEILTSLVSWPKTSTGFFTSGGTLANLTALLTAREIGSGGTYWNSGHRNSKYAIMVSKEAHYSVERAIKIMGLGQDAIISIPTNDDFQADVSVLEDLYLQAVDRGFKIFAIIANAGSTATGSYDDIEAFALFAKPKKIWLHVDGAHGGAVCFSDTYRHLIKGIEEADSMILDFHKLLQTPILSTALLYKSYQSSYQTFTQGAQYLYEQKDQEWYQLGKRTFECTKNMMVLKAYTLIHQLGIKRLGLDIDYRYDLAKQFADLIRMDSSFELATYPASNIVCFRYKPKEVDDEQCDELNRVIRKNILATGKFYLVQTVIDHKTYLRTSLMNPATTLDHLKKLLALIKSLDPLRL